MPLTLTTRRGCGRRIRGGLYWETPPLPSGYILDPPIKIDAERIGLNPVGVKFVVRNGVTHVLDWVGEVFYPNVADFVEETRRLGVSRRLPRNFPFERLTAESRLLLVHRKAWIDNIDALRPTVAFAAYSCPTETHPHQLGETMCAGAWWEDLVQADLGTRRNATRHLPCGHFYHGFVPPTGPAVEHSPAIFASIPLLQIALVAPGEGGEERRLRIAGALPASVPAVIEEV